MFWTKSVLLLTTLLLAVHGERPCDIASQAQLPFCNSKLAIEDRVADLLSRLSVSEKLSQFTNGAPAINGSLDIPAFQWWSEALHGVAWSPGVTFGPQPEVTCATSFPQVINTGATFNTTLFRKIGAAISTEGRAMNNVGQAGLTFWAPNINIFRDPRWGRGQETPGEDPLLTAQYAINYVKGMQEGEDGNHLKVSSCCKHYFDYSLEDWKGMDRHHFDAITTQQDIADTYLPAFEACVREGGASSLMCSYNSVNGVPSCANYPLLTSLARQSWGFEGYITGDCGAVDDIMYTHHFDNSTEATCHDSLYAGVDIDCGSFLNSHLQDAMVKGAVNETLIDDALTHLFSVRFRLGEFDPKDAQPYLSYGKDKIATDEHQQLSLEAAQQSIVLIYNDGVLPLSAAPSVPSLALVGPHADATDALLGNYYGQSCFVHSPADALSKYCPHATVAKGCADVACANTSAFAPAITAAAHADVTIIFAGLDQNQESEGKDRLSLLLPGEQNTLINEVVKAAKGKVILVLITGGAVDVSEVLEKAKEKMSAVLWAGYPGPWGGVALAQILFGEVNPSGRLPVTWYYDSFTQQASMLNMNMRPSDSTPSPAYPGRTYRFFAGTPLFSFGWGNSYSEFKHVIHMKERVVSKADLAGAVALSDRHFFRGHAGDRVVSGVSVDVFNLGPYPGAEVLILVATPPHAGQGGVPRLKMVSFDRVYLAVGANTTVHFPIMASDLTLFGEDGVASLDPAGTWMFSVGHSLAHLTVE